MNAERPLVYADVSALNRPFDRADALPEAERPAVAAELQADAEALADLLERVDLVASPMHYAETSACRDEERRAFVEALLEAAPVQIQLEPLAETQQERLAELLQLGVKLPDAMHVVYAESSAATFITVDKPLIRKLANADTTIPCLTLMEANERL